MVKWVHDNWPWQTDRKPTDCEQRELAEKGDPKYIFTIPRAILPKPSLCDEITATKTSNEIIASQSVDLTRGKIGYFELVQSNCTATGGCKNSKLRWKYLIWYLGLDLDQKFKKVNKIFGEVVFSFVKHALLNLIRHIFALQLK